MPESSVDNEVDARPPLLNRLIVVTLVTIVACFLYLGHHYLGEGPNSKPLWYSLPLFCSPLTQHCSSPTGVGASIGMRLENQKDGTLTVYSTSSGMQVLHISVRATNLDSRSAQKREVSSDRVAFAQRLDLRTSSCLRPHNHWRIELIAATSSRTLGTWSDITLPCVKRPSGQAS